MYYIISYYDIPDDRRRSKLAKTLKDFGDRVQYSVFEARLDHPLYCKMIARIRKIMKDDQDRVRIYCLCG
jgi:CRISPR-associated protein Cas2